MTDAKAILKDKIVKFVTEAFTEGPNPVSFNEFAKNNPDGKQLDKKEALGLAIKMHKEGTLRLVQDNDDIETFRP
jgi:hypothetical protein